MMSFLHQVRSASYSFLRWGGILLFGIVYFQDAVYAQTLQAREEDLKAAFTVKLISFVTFPKESSQVVVCVDGSLAIQEAFRAFEDRAVNSRRVRVLTPSEGFDISSCDILYLDAEAVGRSDMHLSSQRNSSPLTVSDSPEFCEGGGMVQISRLGKTLTFDVNLDQVRAHSLDIRATLLRLARNIIRSQSGN
ncbi:MAG: YfiR family protein [Bdellovibrionales bacterium]|nr:YfiR family protein [Bdellovibrionales bacterium]